MAEKLLNYEVMRRLGEGAASTIYAVRDPATGRMYALKHVERKKPKDIRFVEQMEAEFEISKQFTHPNLRKTYELKISKSLLLKVTEAFLVMELVEGKPLDVRPTATVLDTVITFVHVAMGLRAMHQLGYVHCDIKPNNILIDNTGRVRVIDFGQSCKIGTIKERIQGTPDYIAPEQVNRQPVTVQTDVYNLGATLYWALTGTNSPTLYTVNRQGENSFLLDSRIQTPADFNPLVTPALSKLVMDCISTRRDKRPVDMDAVIGRLDLSRHAMKKPSVDAEPDAGDSGIVASQPRPVEQSPASEATPTQPRPAPDSMPEPFN
jgi:serine/threonine protein kinase